MSAGTGRLLRLVWHTHRVLLVLAPALLAGLVVATAASIRGLYPSPEQREVYRSTMGASPAAAAFNGRGHDLQTLGGITAYEVGFMGQLAFPLVGLVLAVRLTRRLEDSGVLELLTAARIARTAVPMAAGAAAAASWAFFATLSALGLVATGLPLAGSLRYAAVMALFGLAWSATGLLLGQLASTARAAMAAGTATVLAAFLARAVVDGRNGSCTWLSPMGWVAEAHPWGAWRWWPVLCLAVMVLAGAVATQAVAARRDLGSGVLAQRPGRERARRRLATPAGLAWRLGRPGLLGWWLGALAWAAAIGSMTQDFRDVVAKNPSLAQAFGGDVTGLATMLSLVLTSLMASAAGLGLALRAGAEEVEGRGGWLAAGRLPHLAWWAGFTGVALLATAVVEVTSSLLLGLVQWRVLQQRDAFHDAAVAGGWLLAPSLVLVAVGAALAAAAPRRRAVAWLPLAWAALVGLLGEPLRLPGWSRNLSPLHLVGQVPVTPADRGAVSALALGVLALLALAAAVHRRRDLVRG